MASPSSVLTQGLGSWGTPSLLVTLGFGSSEVVAAHGFLCINSLTITPALLGRMTITPALECDATITPALIGGLEVNRCQ